LKKPAKKRSHSKIGFDRKTAQKIFSGSSDHCLWQGASEDENFDAEPT